ncbi:MAG: rhodanese-like domain-containing protein [Alphaproteobacteria bacterium]
MDQATIDMVAEARKLVPAITPGDAANLMDAGSAVAVDVRNAGEVAKSGKIAGALHIPIDRVAEDFAAALDKDKAILLYCASGARSALAGKFLLEHGYADVRNLGAFAQWAESGGAVEHT